MDYRARSLSLLAISALSVVVGGVIGQAADVLIGWGTDFPSSGKSLGLALLAAGLALRYWAASEMYRSKVEVMPWGKPRRLVVSGPFSFSRNPHYLAIFAMTAGYALVIGSTAMLLFVAFEFVGFHLLVTTGEEPDLRKTFSSSYRSYASKVPRWL